MSNHLPDLGIGIILTGLDLTRTLLDAMAECDYDGRRMSLCDYDGRRMSYMM